MNRKDILDKVAFEMMGLYHELKGKRLERAEADSLANVAGKALKAVQLDIADEYLLEEKRKSLPNNDAQFAPQLRVLEA
jgi:hypothetical protein